MAEGDRQHIGRFRILRRLGAGGMGEVFLAHDPRLDRRVALKRIRHGGGVSREARERFRREARSAAALSHPGIVQVYELLEEEGGDSLVMEYVEGCTVAQLLDVGPLEPSRAAALARDVAAALAAAHARGLIHRDLKAENVVVTREGGAKILDFGLAKALRNEAEAGEEETALTAHGALVGTTRAMSPEQARGAPVDARSDLFSLGVLLYEMLTGRSPFRGANPLETLSNVLTADPAPVSKLEPAVPPPLAELVMSLLAKHRDDRPQSAAALLPMLTAAAAPTGLQERPAEEVRGLRPSSTSAPGPFRTPRWRRGLASVAAAALLLALALGVWTYPGGRPPAPPLRVAVLKPQLEGAGGEDGAEESPVASGVLVAALSTLASLEGVEPVDPSELQGLAGTPVALARAVAADEALTSTLQGRGATRTLSLRRIRRRDGTVIRAQRFQVPAAPEESLLLANGVAAGLRRAYPERSVRPGTPDLQASAEAYAAFLRVKQRIDSGQVDWEAELAEVQRIADMEPHFLEAQLLAAGLARDLYTDTGEVSTLEAARPYLRRARALAPQDHRPLAQGFRVALAAGREAEAAAALEALEGLVPASAEVAEARSRLAEARGDLEGAITHMQTAVERTPSWRSLLRLARLEFRAASIPQARRHLEQLSEQVPENEWVRAKLAELELLYGDLTRAEALYRELIASDPHRSDYTNLGLARLLLGRAGAAEEAFRRALEMDPDHPSVLLNLADAVTAQGRREEAGELYRRALDLLRRRGSRASLSAVERMNEAQCLARLGAADEAVALALATLAGNAQDAEVTYQASLVFALAGEQASAAASARKALEMGVKPRWLRIPGFEPVRSHPDLAARLASP